MAKAINLWGPQSGQLAEDQQVHPASKTAPPRTHSSSDDAGAYQEPPLEAGSWEHRRQVLPEQNVNDRRHRDPTVLRMPRDKRRRQVLSVVVSQEEEDILRAVAVAADMSFSEWAREALFKVAKRKIPARDRR